jgi:hypothetical protein
MWHGPPHSQIWMTDFALAFVAAGGASVRPGDGETKPRTAPAVAEQAGLEGGRGG